jgi:hypothetical protein
LERRLIGLMRRRRSPLVIAAVLLAGGVFVYRFNALGGSFGGFDNDHFLQLALAKQVQAGAQPLRDFSDAVQGARPSLTYELSAAAQRWLGDAFLSEALLTVSGVTLGAVVTFAAGARLAPWPWALAITVLSVLLSPKLYAYPKVLVLAVASLLIVWYAERPGRSRAASLGVWTAIAFLFRHDYAVYCGAGAVAVMAAAHRSDPRTALERIGGCGLLAFVLLIPSLWWVHSYAGLGEYARNALEISAREAERTGLHEWPAFTFTGVDSVAAFFGQNDNTRAWLYYTLIALPWIGVAAAGGRWLRRIPDPRGWTAAVAGLSVLAGISAKFFLRGNLPARFSEVAPVAAVLALALLGSWTARGTSRALPWLARGAMGALLVAITAASIVVLLRVPAELRSTYLNAPGRAVEQTMRVLRELRTLPGAMRETGPADRMQAADYVHRCTKPGDRVLVFLYAPEIEVFAERLFAGGRAVFVSGYYAREKYSRDALGWLERESVPIIIAEPEETSAVYRGFPLLAEYIRANYHDVGSVMSGTPLRVLARRDRVPTGTGVNGLPCFAA